MPLTYLIEFKESIQSKSLCHILPFAARVDCVDYVDYVDHVDCVGRAAVLVMLIVLAVQCWVMIV